jgi:superkiller protein 3
VQVWENTTTLFSHAISVTEGNMLAHNALAVEAMKHGDLTTAGAQVTKALQIKANYPAARYTLGMILVQQRDFNKAIEQYNLALQSSQPGTMAATIWNGLGGAKAQLGRLDEAVSDYHRALELNPNYADAYTNLASDLVAQGKFGEAAESAEKAVALRPRSADAHASLALALMNLGRTDESILENRKALEFNQNLVAAQLNLATALSKKGNYDEAIAHIEYVLRLDPKHEVAQKLLSDTKQKRDSAGTER